MGGYALNGVFIFDSSKRGIRVKAAEVIPRENFTVITCLGGQCLKIDIDKILKLVIKHCGK